MRPADRRKLSWVQRHLAPQAWQNKQLHWLLVHTPSKMPERRVGITNKDKQSQRQKAYTAPLARRHCRACRCALEECDAAVVEAGSGVDSSAAKPDDGTNDGAADSGAAKLVDGVADGVAEDGSGSAQLDDDAPDGAAELE